MKISTMDLCVKHERTQPKGDEQPLDGGQKRQWGLGLIGDGAMNNGMGCRK